MKIKGFGCSFYGKKYELEVFSIVKNCEFIGNGNMFNTQFEHELGGCSSTPFLISNADFYMIKNI